MNYRQNDRLYNLIRGAERRERNDDHLSLEERREIVELHREVYPNEELSGDVNDDFVRLVF